MPRIVSLIASATEMVCALGYEWALVGRSHECDYPESVRSLPVCTAPKFDVDGSSIEIDQRVKEAVADGASVYRVHADVLMQLEPDVIVTQAQCEVCAVSERDVLAALDSCHEPRPKIVTLSPNALADVWDDLRRVGEALGAPENGRAVARSLQSRCEAIQARASSLSDRPSVACLEWIDPLMAAGNWVPELVAIAGGIDPFGTAGRHAPAMTWEQLLRLDPDVIVGMPCGLSLERTREEMAILVKRSGWESLRAVQAGRVIAVDGNQFFNRPGPRLVESAEILAEIFHPAKFRYGHEGCGWQRL